MYAVHVYVQYCIYADVLVHSSMCTCTCTGTWTMCISCTTMYIYSTSIVLWSYSSLILQLVPHSVDFNSDVVLYIRHAKRKRNLLISLKVTQHAQWTNCGESSFFFSICNSDYGWFSIYVVTKRNEVFQMHNCWNLFPFQTNQKEILVYQGFKPD